MIYANRNVSAVLQGAIKQSRLLLCPGGGKESSCNKPKCRHSYHLAKVVDPCPYKLFSSCSCGFLMYNLEVNFFYGSVLYYLNIIGGSDLNVSSNF